MSVLYCHSSFLSLPAPGGMWFREQLLQSPPQIIALVKGSDMSSLPSQAAWEKNLHGLWWERCVFHSLRPVVGGFWIVQLLKKGSWAMLVWFAFKKYSQSTMSYQQELTCFIMAMWSSTDWHDNACEEKTVSWKAKFSFNILFILKTDISGHGKTIRWKAFCSKSYHKFHIHSTNVHPIL